MTFQHPIWQNPLEYLAQEDADIPICFFNPKVLRNTTTIFQSNFNGLITFALKANPDPLILNHLIAAGINSFDVASPTEIDLAQSLNENVTLHYNNPVRSIDEIQYAVSKGIKSFSIDRLSELKKLIPYLSKDTEISVRLKLDIEGAAYNFGSKFGAEPKLCAELLRKAFSEGLRTSMTFHVGTQCSQPDIWVNYIKACAKISSTANIKLYRLNIGGGFPSNRSLIPVDLIDIFTKINSSVRQEFLGHTPEILCEPGRALVAESCTLAVRIKARSDDILFINDGIYGGLSEFKDIGHCERYKLYTSDGVLRSGQTQKFITFGPTCDSLDKLPSSLTLPKNSQEGDYILIEGMGAYMNSIATKFNGYGQIRTILVNS